MITKPKTVAIAAMPFHTPAPRPTKLKLVTPVSGGRSWTEAIAPLSGANGGANSGSERRDTIGDFVHAGRGGLAKTMPKSVMHGDEIHLTLIDVILTTLLFLSTLTGPALVWVLLQTAS